MCKALVCDSEIKLITNENETAQIKQLCIPQAPSVSFADSSLPEGASSYMFLQKTAMLMRKRNLESEPPSGREVARRSRDGRSHRAQMQLYFVKLRSFSGASRLGTLGISSPNPRQGTSPLDPMFASRLSKKLSQLYIPTAKKDGSVRNRLSFVIRFSDTLPGTYPRPR